MINIYMWAIDQQIVNVTLIKQMFVGRCNSSLFKYKMIKFMCGIIIVPIALRNQLERIRPTFLYSEAYIEADLCSIPSQICLNP